MRTFLIIGLILFGCASKEAVPAGILTSEEMVEMYSEMYLAEEKVNRMGLPRDSAVKVFKIIERKVFEKTKVSDTVFRQSIHYYMDRPLEMEQIYTAVVDSLNLREQRTTVKSVKE
ncbi:DUF4296 domain-containing protein [Pseudochryseolinea flava]|nr:DUF4296 domain-containing protein [Pseudochryseolinea flava]